ncbi:MAG: ABC transporter ATP-binding protein [Chloroflexota bacterium]|nr:ABC transporter ATP-binding protein [Chloroflexota bacterium]MDE2896444.1 ABC transporter ATP-binding protein [Chloroflexota bacterium]
MPPVLTIDDVSIEYNTREGPVRAVRGASLSLERGEIVALVGESGSGKTTLGLGILRILPRNANQTSGTIRYEHRDVGQMDRQELQRIRGDQISMIFQDPIAGLNPIITVGQQVEEVITSHRTVTKNEARERSLEALNAMRLPDPIRVAKSYPGELSGGMCQRIMIAIATALDPQVLIADEPTASLDVTVQAQILYELERLRDERGTAILLITHDMGVVAQIAERVAIIYAGSMMEVDDVIPLYRQPRHPYTWALLDTLPRLDRRRGSRLRQIPGGLPDLTSAEIGEHCAYLDRCPKALTKCRTDGEPALSEVVGGRIRQRVACYNPVLEV